MRKRHPMIKCHAKNRQGGVCAHWAMHGQKVCFLHGGKSPQALRKAEDRLRDLVDPAITGLAELIKRADSDSVRLGAIRDLLDRTGFKPSVQVQSENELIVRIVREEQPIVLEQSYDHGLSNGRADD